MLLIFKRIIKRMLDFYKRVWQAFLLATPALVGIASFFKDCLWAFIFLLILASISLVIALIGLRYDYLDARRKDREAKKERDIKALRESVKRMNPEYTEKQLDAWMHDL